DRAESACASQRERRPKKSAEQAFHSSGPGGTRTRDVSLTRGIVCNSRASVNRLVRSRLFLNPTLFLGSTSMGRCSWTRGNSHFYRSRRGREPTDRASFLPAKAECSSQ